MPRKPHALTGSWTLALLLLSGATLTGCGGPAEKPAPPSKQAPAARDAGKSAPAAASAKSPLAGTEWQLVEIRSMDDAVGTTRPDDPSLYTMRLDADGTASMRLNCNRATGSWTAEPSQDPSNGRFEFGPLAGTLAVCPPPSLDEQITAQAQYIRGYMLADGRLHLSLMADGGIWVWEPLSAQQSKMTPDAKIEAAILAAAPDYTRKTIGVEGGIGPGRYAYERVDLNDDGRDEVLVYLLGSIFCGTGGCNLMLFTEGTDGYSLVDSFPITQLPVTLSANKTSGWHDIVKMEAGGGAPQSYVRYTFDGTHYVEAERLPGEPAPEGRRVLDGEITFQNGIPLEPRI